MKILLLPILYALCASVHATESSAPVENGTDPTRLPRTVQAQWEHVELDPDKSGNTLRISYTQPLGEKQDYSLRLRVPVTAVDMFDNNNYGMGDASVMLSHVFGLTREHGFVVQGEMVFNTAERSELGTGKDVFKANFIYAKFLSQGSIFAPSAQQSHSLSGESTRPDVNMTTFDFYYVPKMKDPHNLVTFDPATNIDWENDKRFFSLAVTAGRVFGKAMGGNAIAYMKPTVFSGNDKPGRWGIEAGCKIVGF